jgi:hypothetical protein
MHKRGWNGKRGDDIIASRGVTKWPADRRPVAHDQSDSRVSSSTTFCGRIVIEFPPVLKDCQFRLFDCSFGGLKILSRVLVWN